MKQVQKTPDIISKLRQSVGADVDVEKVSVFEAIALNTLPLRKRHPLYNGSKADRSLLLELAADVIRESKPVQVQHNTDPLPIGRVFHGEVIDTSNGSELRVLFFIDRNEEDTIAKVDNGTVDQVSVSVLPRHIYNSVSGFDYLGADATFEHVWSGTDPDGNTIGENGVFGKMVGLDAWFEMSLVGQGGARNARIVSRDASHFGSSYQKLAASGVDPNALVLVASTRNETMDLKELVAELTDAKVTLALKDKEVETLTASVTERDQRIAELEAKLAAVETPDETAAQALSEAQANLSAAAQDRDAAVATLKEVAQKVLAAAGKPDATAPETVAELQSLIASTETGLSAVLVAGGRSKDAVTAPNGQPEMLPNLGAFRIRK